MTVTKPWRRVWPCETHTWCSPVTWDTWHLARQTFTLARHEPSVPASCHGHMVTIPVPDSSHMMAWWLHWSGHTLVIMLSEHRHQLHYVSVWIPNFIYVMGSHVWSCESPSHDGIPRIRMLQISRTLWGITKHESESPPCDVKTPLNILHD